MEPTNQRTVFVAHANDRLDTSAAEKFGKLRDVFSSVSPRYNTDKMIEHARRVLSNWQEGDSILMIGDPSLCAICVAVAAEYDSVVNILSWDRNEYQYIQRRWDFTPNDDLLTTSV
jgi:hypothetical protein